MEILKNLIRVDALLLALFAWLEAFGTRNSRTSADDPSLSLLGTGLLACAVLLLLAGDLMLVSGQRKLGRCLAAANVVFAFMVFLHSRAYSVDMAFALVGIPLILAGALVWASLLPLRPEEAAAELIDLRIPDEVRQALLRQVGEAAAQEERNRLARDLHDSVKQQLFTINVGAATAQERWERDPEGAQAALVDVRRSAREAMVEMQAMLHQLRPQALTSATGLVEALREQAEALGYRSGAQVTVELGPEIPDDRMPPGVREALFRIAQEALANVARHARAGTVRVWIGREGEDAVLRVEDDGQGFDPEAAVSGMGLRNLRERAAALRGRVDIESAPGSGSAVRVRIPLLTPIAPALSPLKDQLGFLRKWDSSWVPWWLAILSVLFADIEDGFSDISIYVLNPLLFAMGRRLLMGVAYPTKASLFARFRFISHLWNFSWIFVATLGSWSFWAQSRAHSKNELVWLTVAGFCLVWVVFELVAFHRWSERRREWRTLVLPARWSFNAVVWILVMILWVLGFPLSPIQTVWSAVILIFFLYVLSRRPRLGETHP